MKVSGGGIGYIKKHEGLRLTAYRCAAGVLTIGYGHTGPDVTPGETITEEEAELILRRDLARFEACVARTCPKATTHEFDAMVSLAYNIGEDAFEKSSVARLHNAGKKAEAAQAFALWNKAKGRVLPGLVKRRAEEAAQYLTPWPSDMDVHVYASEADGEAPLAKSRGIAGQSIAAAGTAGTIAASAVDLQQFAWLLPYVAEIKWLLIALIVAGIGYAVYARVSDRHSGRC